MYKFGIALLSVVVVAVSFLACSKMDTQPGSVSYEPTWAAVYDCVGATDSEDDFWLILVQGRTDDDFALTSSGAALSLRLCADRGKDLIPTGLYSSPKSSMSYSIVCSSGGDAFGTAYSFVAERRNDSRHTDFHAVDSGTLHVSLADGQLDDRVFVISAEIEADGRTYQFEYMGPVQDFRAEADSF